MLDRHAVQELRRAGVTARAIAQQFGVSVRTVRRIGREPAVTAGGERRASRSGGAGRPRVSDGTRARVAALVGAERDLPPGEIWRRLREEGTPLGLSTVYRLLAAVRATLPADLLVRFEGVAGCSGPGFLDKSAA